VYNYAKMERGLCTGKMMLAYLFFVSKAGCKMSI